MTRRSARLEVVELGGDRFPDMETVQGAALPLLTGELGRVLRGLLESGALVVRDGKIVVNPEKERPET